MNHGGCKYFGWNGLKQICRNPKHPGTIYPRRVVALMQCGGKCQDFVEWESKVLPGSQQVWPKPVPSEEVA